MIPASVFIASSVASQSLHRLDAMASMGYRCICSAECIPVKLFNSLWLKPFLMYCYNPGLKPWVNKKALELALAKVVDFKNLNNNMSNFFERAAPC